MAEHKSRSTQQRAPRPDYGDHHRRNKNDFGGGERLKREEADGKDQTEKTYETRQSRPEKRHQNRRFSDNDYHNQPPKSYREYKPVRKNHQAGDDEHKGGMRYPDVKQSERHGMHTSGRKYAPDSNQPIGDDVKMSNTRKYERNERYHKEHHDNVVEKRFAKREYTEKLQEEGKLPRKFEYGHRMNPSLDRRMNSADHRQRKERQPKGGQGRYRFGDEKPEIVKEPEFSQKMVSLNLNEAATDLPREVKKDRFAKLAVEHKEKIETSSKPTNYRSLEDYLAEE
eukprot:GAHX01000116.1.p1 GENE.GAHX01000116.1~~GAHX01000116.1.p1  ORF type:complete len:283 (-),score=56.82 GAHX01000116.1:38-886(-)